jgi:2-haloacid dehalogenase
MSLSEVRALTFDVFGTVVDWRTSVARELAARFGPGGAERDWPAIADRWRALYQPAMEAVRGGRRPWVKLDDLHRENLAQVLAEFDLGGLDEAALDHLNRAWHRLDPWPDVVAGLTRLKRRYILATLSNGNVALMVNLARHAGLPWDAILGAEVAQAYKPLPAAYLRTAGFLGLEPAACIMVAAHNDDLVVAGGLGFRTAFVARPHEHGAAQTRDRTAAHGFDVVARDFGDLADQLGGAAG